MSFEGNVSFIKKEISMDEYRPHMVIPTPLAHHVYPVAYFERFCKGDTVEPIPHDVMAVIVQEWLNSRKE